MSTVGTVRVWYAEDGWGVVDSAETPGGCWTHFSHLAMPGILGFDDGQQVELEWEAPGQDGFDFRAVRAWPRGEKPHDRPVVTTPSSAYTSVLTITFSTLTGINRYPVKSCRGHALDEATVEPWGLAGDRRWILVDDEGVAVTARTQPRMVLITPHPQPDGLLVEAAGMAPLTVEFPGSRPVDVRVFASTVPGVAASDEAHAWFSAVLGMSVRLVYLADPTRRPTDPLYGLDTDVVSFADGYPMLLANEESLAALDALGPEPLTIARFRPNLVVTGFPAWEEDRWRRVRIGDATFRVVKSCARCVLTTVDPETGTKGQEPLRTLARHRRWDGKTWFGVNLVPDTPGAVLRVSDPVEVLESVESAEPQRISAPR